MNLDVEKVQMDIEWVMLIKEAKSIGLTIEEIQFFLTEFRNDSTSGS